MKARDYYNSTIPEGHRGQSYQKIYLRDIFEKHNDREGRKIFNHVSNLSNDRLLENLINSLIIINSGAIKERLQNVFVAKVHDFVANASAVEATSYYGDLVYFYVGLSDVCFQFTTLFSELLYVRKSSDKGATHRSEALISFFVNIDKFSKASRRWRKYGDYIKLQKEDVVITPFPDVESKAISMACLSDKFILCHEFSHHLLGHTCKPDVGSNLLNTLPDECKAWLKSSVEHKKEFQADALALIIMFGAPNNEKKIRDMGIEIALGSLLTLFTLKLLDDDPDKAGYQHPPINERILYCKRMLKTKLAEEVVNEIYDDIEGLYNIIDNTRNNTKNV